MSDREIDSLSTMRLFQLASSNLPVGGYTFSQGLEYAIDSGWLTSEENLRDWIAQVTDSTLIHTDLPLILRQIRAIIQTDWQALRYWNNVSLAVRETEELLLADTAMGEAMLRVANGMDIPVPEVLLREESRLSFLTMYSIVAVSFGLDEKTTMSAYAWTVLESQVLAATKLLPMGQTAAQRMLYDLSRSVADTVTRAQHIEDKYIGISLPGLAMASSKHQDQYSRLYRS